MTAGVITVDLAAAGLTHARGASDKCGGKHDVDMRSVTDVSSCGLVDPEDFGPVLQALHEQAHPGGTRWWGSCRERGCVDAAELGA
jgi:hypothetical protein